MLLAISQPSESALQRPLQLVCRFFSRTFQRRCCVRDGNRLASFEPRLDHAVLIILPALGSVSVTEMDFHSRDLLSEMRESLPYRFFGLGRQVIAPGYVVVGTDFDVHHYSLQGVHTVWTLGHSLQQRVPSNIASSMETQVIDRCQVEGNQTPPSA